MASRDIMPWTSPHGQTVSIEYYPMIASETFGEGEPVSVNADGELTESAADPAAADVLGIALAGPGSTTNNFKTNAAWATGDPIPVAIPSSSQLFITQNYSEAGSAFNDTAPVVARIGDEAGLARISNDWGIDISQSNNTCRIVDILDDLKRSLLETGATVATTDTYYVVFKIVQHQSIIADAPAA